MTHHFTEKENKAWLQGLPKKSVAVKVIIVSDQGNILLVKPNYKPTWQFPGGGVEPSEDPKEAAQRELAEELGLSMQPDDLRLLDTAFRKEHDNLILIYEYMPRVAQDIALTIQTDEIEGFTFEPPENVYQHLASYYHEFWRKYLNEKQGKGQ